MIVLTVGLTQMKGNFIVYLNCEVLLYSLKSPHNTEIKSKVIQEISLSHGGKYKDCDIAGSLAIYI